MLSKDSNINGLINYLSESKLFYNIKLNSIWPKALTELHNQITLK